MPRSLASRLRLLRTKLGFEQNWYLVLLAAAIGVVTSGVAMAFIWLIHELAALFDHAAPGQLMWLVPLLPMAGALVTGFIVYFVAAEARGHGVPEVLHAIHANRSRIGLRVAIAKWCASVFSIGSGGSAGAEGPIVQIGSALGSKIGQWLRANPQQTATLLGCGAAAGIASVFNAPIAGIFFVLEILLRDFSIRTFTPIVIASVFSAAVTQAMHGGADALFATSGDFDVEAFTALEIPNYLIMGVLCGFVALAFIHTLDWTERFYAKINIHPIIKPVTGAALLGLLGLAYLLFFREPGEPGLPPMYSNGYPVIRELLSVDHYQGVATTTLLTGLIAVAVLKGLATCLTLGSGGSGGVFAPSLMLGACVGGAFGTVINALDWFPHASAAHYSLVGMAAVVAATTHAPLTAILIVYEITRSYSIILPLMLAAVIATVVARLVTRQSIYTLKLSRRGIRIGAMSDLTVLRRLSVSNVSLLPAVSVNADESAQRLLDLSERYSVSDFVVADDRKHYEGLVTASDLKEALVYREAIPLLQVSELQRSDLPTVTPHETLDSVLDKFAQHDVQSLAVVDSAGNETVIGVITRARLMERYQRELDKD